MRVRFVNLRIPGPENSTLRTQLVVARGRFQTISPDGEEAPLSDEIVDLGGRLVLPGVIDGHVHFSDPGFTYRETFATGTRAAAAGGVTCVADMPCTSLPPVTSRASLHTKLEAIAGKAHVDFMLWVGVSANAMTAPAWTEDLAEAVADGAVAIKVYMCSGMESFADLGRQQLCEVLVQARRSRVAVGVHAEDREMVRELTAKITSSGQSGPAAYAATRPAAVEEAAVSTIRDLVREVGAQVHIVHVGSGQALEIISQARAEGLPLSAETCPHFLAFTDQDFERLGAVLKTAPVVKAEADRQRLWQGLANGDLELIASDHAAGRWPEEKQTASILTDYGGIPGVELTLPYLLSEGVAGGRITLERLTEITAAAPARLFGIDSCKGRIAAGLDADFVVVDDSEDWTVRGEDLHNLNRYTPLEGQRLTGRVRATYVRGDCVYRREDDGSEFFGPAGTGQWLRRPSSAGI